MGVLSCSSGWGSFCGYGSQFKIIAKYGLQHYFITSCIAHWVMEASILPHNISLIFDAAPAPEQATHIFQDVVQRDVAWQLARK